MSEREPIVEFQRLVDTDKPVTVRMTVAQAEFLRRYHELRDIGARGSDRTGFWKPGADERRPA